MATQTQLTCVFWNVAGKDLSPLVARMAAEHAAHVVVLAENGADRGGTLRELRRSVDRTFSDPKSEQTRIHVFGRHDGLDLRETYADASGRLTVRCLRLGDEEFLFAAAHFPSKTHWDRGDQAAESGVLSEQIRGVEAEHGHARTILVGDLNMNPFEDGMVQANGLHAMMTRATTEARARQVQGREYPFFYNPMWGCFGDRTPGPPGTFYLRRSAHLSYDWNIFDQVLLRADVLPFFEDVEIVTRIGETGLIAVNGRPDTRNASDHLPILFRLRVPTTQRV